MLYSSLYTNVVPYTKRKVENSRFRYEKRKGSKKDRGNEMKRNRLRANILQLVSGSKQKIRISKSK